MSRLSSHVAIALLFLFIIPRLVAAGPLDTTVDNNHHLMWQVRYMSSM